MRPPAVLLALLLAGPIIAAPQHNVRVLVLNYDPFVPSMGGQRLHKALGWQKPAVLAQGYIDELANTTQGHVRHTIVQWIDLDEIPIKIDGYQYSADEYVQNWLNGGGWHTPDLMDYVLELKAKGVPAMIDANLVDEVWLFGGPYFGYWEAAMAGPGAFFINGGVYPQIDTVRPFVIMGFNYERQVAEMLHNLGHRTENSVKRVFGGVWDMQNPTTDWDWFTVNKGQSSALAGVGNTHFPANGTSDYDYGNTNPVDSSALDWANYPYLTGATTPVSMANWGAQPSTHQAYMRFWFGLLPRARGVHPVHGRACDWFAFVYDWLSYDSNGRPDYGPPEVYCTSKVNSTGQAAAMTSSGSTSFSANDLVLATTGCPPGQFGLYFFGQGEQQIPLGDGWLCVGGTLRRLPALTIDVFGLAIWPLDLAAPPAANQVVVGTQYNFQLWFRDPSGPGGTGSNTSDGLRVVFSY